VKALFKSPGKHVTKVKYIT